jgi:hypothetical protein
VLVRVGEGVSDGWAVAVLSPSTGVGGKIEGVVSLQANAVRLSRSSRSEAAVFASQLFPPAGRAQRVEEFERDGESKNCLRNVDWRVFYYKAGRDGMEDAPRRE